MLFFAFGAMQGLFAQNCAAPALLCAESDAVPFEPTSPPLTTGCFDAQNTSYFQFTTNTADQPGFANINVETWECDSTPTDLQVVVVEYSVLNPCDASQYVVVGNCETSAMPLSFQTADLDPDTDYLVILGTNTDTSINSCNAEVSISGPAVDIDACCDGEVPLGDPYEMTVVGGSDPIGTATHDYQWGPSSQSGVFDDTSIPDPTVFPEQTTTFSVTATVGDCEVTDFVTVIVGPPISIPNTITPNGDNINDFWLIGGMDRFDGATVTVYDRWGQTVFTSIGYAQPWDGTNEGTKLKTATYYYVIELNSLDVPIEPITGSITLIH